MVCPYGSKNEGGLSVSTIEDPSVVIHPDLSQAYQVTEDSRGTIWKAVGALVAEYVANNRTRNDL